MVKRDRRRPSRFKPPRGIALDIQLMQSILYLELGVREFIDTVCNLAVSMARFRVTDIPDSTKLIKQRSRKEHTSPTVGDHAKG